METTGENYDCVRDGMNLETYDCDTGQAIVREPTNAELLQLLDALRADLTGEIGPELAERNRQRYWSS